MITLDEWLAHLEAAEVALVPALEGAVAGTTIMMTALAREYIGHQQGLVTAQAPDATFYVAAWAPLADSTMDDKRRLGVVGPDGMPLYRTGAMKESISGAVNGLTGIIGSDSKIALYQEMGTAKIPPRPFLARAVIAGLPILDVRLTAVGREALIPKSERR